MVPMQYCSWQHWALLSPPDTSTTEHRFHFGPAASFFLELLVVVLCFSPVACWTPSDLGGSYSSVVSFCLFMLSRCSRGKNAGVGCYSLLAWTTFCQNPPLWLVHPGWPWAAWLTISLSYKSPFATARLWSMKGCLRESCVFVSDSLLPHGL